jgi:hypothetical protein
VVGRHAAEYRFQISDPSRVVCRKLQAICDHEGMSDGMDDTRAAIEQLGLIGEASQHLTTEIAMHLPFEELGPFKDALKQYFSRAAWTPADEARLSALVTAHVPEGMWEHDLGSGISLTHGIVEGMYLIRVEGGSAPTASVFDRAFAGPVIPEATPHPRKVKFQVGGDPAPGAWYRRGEAIDDDRVIAIFADDDITDVMVAGDFVTIGISGRSSWEERLDPLLERVTELFWDGQTTTRPERTRDELLEEAGRLSISEVRPEDLHLMDPDRQDHRALLIAALDADDPRHRRAAVATLALSAEIEVAQAAVVTGYREESRVVRRTALDAAADLENDVFRPLFEEAVFDRDPWIRWRAVRAIADIGAAPSEEQIILATADEDFQVRLEANTVWRSIEPN